MLSRRSFSAAPARLKHVDALEHDLAAVGLGEAHDRPADRGLAAARTRPRCPAPRPRRASAKRHRRPGHACGDRRASRRKPVFRSSTSRTGVQFGDASVIGNAHSASCCSATRIRGGSFCATDRRGPAGSAPQRHNRSARFRVAAPAPGWCEAVARDEPRTGMQSIRPARIGVGRRVEQRAGRWPFRRCGRHTSPPRGRRAARSRPCRG